MMDWKAGSLKCKIIIIGAGVSGLTAAVALRRAGHEVHVYESRTSENEPNEALHICPNANIALHHIGIDYGLKGGKPIEIIQYYTAEGALLGSIDMEKESQCWQKPWLVARRVDFLKHLEEVACSERLQGLAVKIYRGIHVMVVNTEDNTVRFENNEEATADLIISADGLHSIARQPKTDIPSVHSMVQNGHPTSPGTPLETSQEGSMAYVDPPRNNVKVFVAEDCGVVVTTSEMRTSITIVGFDVPEDHGLNRAAMINKVQNVIPAARGYVQNSIKEDIIVFSLIGTDIVPAWTENGLAFVGNAACYFSSHLICGTTVAIEDGVSLGVLLSGLKAKGDIRERLGIYEKTRRDRVIQLKDFSLKTWNDLKKGHFQRKGTDYAFSHDEVHHATQLIRQHTWDNTSRIIWRQPVGFGPMMSPRQHISRSICSNPRPDRLGEARSLTASIRFRTSKSLLLNLLPSNKYTFSKRGDIAEASFVFQSIENLAWLGGGGYNLVLFQIHDIQHRGDANGVTRDGSYVALVLEDLADPIVSGREDLGWPKLYSEIGVIDEIKSGGGLSATLSWRGFKWLSLSWNNLQPYQQSPQPVKASPDHVFVHKYIPATTETPNRQAADADYDVLMPPASPVSKPIQWQHNATNPLFTFESGTEQELPTLWHVVDRLAELPNLGIVEARIGTKDGQDDFSGAIRV